MKYLLATAALLATIGTASADGADIYADIHACPHRCVICEVVDPNNPSNVPNWPGAKGTPLANVRTIPSSDGGIVDRLQRSQLVIIRDDYERLWAYVDPIDKIDYRRMMGLDLIDSEHHENHRSGWVYGPWLGRCNMDGNPTTISTVTSYAQPQPFDQDYADRVRQYMDATGGARGNRPFAAEFPSQGLPPGVLPRGEVGQPVPNISKADQSIERPVDRWWREKHAEDARRAAEVAEHRTAEEKAAEDARRKLCIYDGVPVDCH
jgi:hypothetical protein